MDQTREDDAAPSGLIGRLLQRLQVDRAVFYALLLRTWQLPAGAVTMLLILQFFTPATQGFYYVIAGMLMLQTFFELGFNIVIMNVSSHEWANLELDGTGRIRGDASALSRLVSLGRLVFAWYGFAGLAFITLVGLGGVVFFAEKTAVSVEWLVPWLCVVTLNGLLLWTLPFNALLEGCNQVATVNRFRVIQAVSANVAIWITIALGGALWALVAGAAARLACDLYLLCVHYRAFFRPFLRQAVAEKITWFTEVWPMQWRLAVGGVFAYFATYHLFTLVMFHYHDAPTAGRMGMTWNLLTALQAAALAWVQTRVPRFGGLIAKGRFAELDRLFGQLTFISLAVIAAGGLALVALVSALNGMESRLADRLLSPLPTLLLALGVLVLQFPHCQAFYMRAHKREPLLAASVLSNTGIGLLVWVLGSRFGPTGAALGYLLVVTLFTFPYQTYLWLRCRREWH